MTRDFDELVGRDLEPEERARLLRTHELLLAAGPLPELPPTLAEPPSAQSMPAEIVPFFNRRRHASIAILAAAIAAAAFGIGYLTGHQGNGGGIAVKQTFAMRAVAGAPVGAIGSIAVGGRDDSGNWPMVLRVSHLRDLQPGGYYTVWLTRKGRAVAPCGYFVVSDKPNQVTEVRLTVPYKLSRFDGWVVTEQKPKHHEPGRVVLTTV